MYCKYKTMFGEVGKGLHSYRILDIAIIDVLLTILGAYLIHRLFPRLNFNAILFILVILGIILHRLFCVRTKVDKLLFH